MKNFWTTRPFIHGILDAEALQRAGMPGKGNGLFPSGSQRVKAGEGL